MKVIAFEEHYKIPAIAQANKDNPIEQIYEKWQKLGRFPGNPSQGVPPASTISTRSGLLRWTRLESMFRFFPTLYRVRRNWSWPFDLTVIISAS
jgi:hypothetical protein